MPRESTSRDWFKKAEADYFSAFIKLWLSFNALYRRDYRGRNFGSNDRMHIETLKTEDNSLKKRFRRMYEEESDEAKEFRLYLSELIRKYDGGLFGGRKIVKNEKVKPQMHNQPLDDISFKKFIHPRSIQLKRHPSKTAWSKIGKVYVRKSPDEIWPYFIEIIYMVRNLLIHGEMEPTEENHNIIKNCYHLLNTLIKDEV